MSRLWDFIDGLRQEAEAYGVSPRIFVCIYLLTWPLWYYTMWLVVNGWHRGDRPKIRRGIWWNRLVTVMPYAYILLAGGRGMPWTWYAFAVLLPIITTSLFLHRVNDDMWMEKWWSFYQRQIRRFRLHEES